MVSRGNQITFYDAVYLALAEDLGDQFITADEVLSRKVKDLGFVQLLKNI
jgi:predicted nucleic acid-binding protein